MKISDLFDLNRYFFDPGYDLSKYSSRPLWKYFSISCIRAILVLIKYPIDDVVNIFRLPGKRKTWVYVGTSRQYDSIVGIEEYVDDAILVNSSGRVDNVKVHYLAKSITILIVPVSIIYTSIAIILNLGKIKRFLYGYFDVLFTLPRIINYYLWIKVLKPRRIVILNDFKSEYLALGYAANMCGVPVLFYPHGISYPFHGKYIYETYMVYGKKQRDDYCDGDEECEKRFKIVGSVKYGRIKRVELCDEVKSICIAINIGADFDIVERLINDMKVNIDVNIILRPHPGQDLEREARRLQVLYSNPYTETLNELFERTDCVIACGSNILLDAAYAGILALSFQFSRANNNCSFEESGICELVHDINGINEAINLNQTLVRKQTESVSYFIADIPNPLSEIAKVVNSY